MIRKATIQDAGLFLSLWSDHIAELLDLGGDILPTEKSMAVFLEYFAAYVTGQLDGVVLIDPDGAVLMWGETAKDQRLDTVTGPSAQGWGTYVAPNLRRKGISKQMREMGLKELREKGFRHLIGVVSVENEAGLRSSLALGMKPTFTLVSMDLSENEDGV